ncbi:ATP-dependent DNA helicase [Rickettsiales bacterium LUAb2]
MQQNTLFVSYNHNIACVFNQNSGEISTINLNSLKNLATKNIIITCNLKHLHSKFDLPINSNCLDILELYAFLAPNLFATNTIYGISKALQLDLPNNLEQEALNISNIIATILQKLTTYSPDYIKIIATLTNFLFKHNWNWSKTILDAIPEALRTTEYNPLNIINNLSEIEKVIPSLANNTSASNNNFINITTAEVTEKLNFLTPKNSLPRANQLEYALAVAKMYNQDNNNANPEEIVSNIAFTEAGTGIGKTLGYLSAALSFVEKNPTSTTLISTFSKTLQKQIFTELKNKLANSPLLNKITLIKGSNNYACLLKFEYILNSISYNSNNALLIAILTNWLSLTENGDIEGGDLINWLSNIIDYKQVNNLLYKRDECIYSKCPYYKKCFITKIKQKVKQSNIIISNHTLTLLNNFTPNYIIFDEAHNLYNTADEVYSSSICGLSGIYLKNWLLGSNSRLNIKNNNLNGVKQRLLSLIKNDTNEAEKSKEHEAIDYKIKQLMETLIFSIKELPNFDYLDKVLSYSPTTNFEKFLYYIYLHVLAHNSDLESYYSQESYPLNLSEDFLSTISSLKVEFNNILKVALSLKVELKAKIAFVKEENQKSIDEFINSFEYNFLNVLNNFIAMLDDLIKPGSAFIYRFVINKEDNNITNIGYFKNYINPMFPLANTIVKQCNGVTFTSATLIDPAIDFTSLNLSKKFGLAELTNCNIVSNIQIKSPFDYQKNSKVIILNNNYSNSVHYLSTAISELFLAAKGGGAAIFTAITRLRASYKNINNILQQNNINLLTQHYSEVKSSSIIELFKEDVNSCILGTDAIRDGIDIPGKSLRMVIFEKVPWCKRDILNNTRIKHFGKEFSNESVRFKLQQAFGRIIRSETDKGVFVLLTPSVPSEFLSAFPETTEILKISLPEALTTITNFLGKDEK